MRIGPIQIERRFLRSRVARRFFAVFVTCSLVPVAAFAWFAHRRAAEQLETDALANLRRESRSAGLATIERLLLADERLQIGTGGSPIEAPAAWGHGIQRVFRLGPDDPLLEPLAAAARRRLADGEAVVLALPDASPPARLLLLRADPAGEPGTLVAAELDPEYVFVAARRALTDRYWVEDGQGRVLFEAPEGGRLTPVEENRSAVARGALDFDLDGEPQLGFVTPLFLSPFEGPSWSIAFSRPRAVIHRPLAEFDSTFPLVAVIAFALSAALSLWTIRRSLVPIDALAHAARRISDRRFETRVQIGTRDEFQELGRAFNEMAQAIEEQIDALATMNEIGAALSAETDMDALGNQILRGSMTLVAADVGAIFLLTDDGGLVLDRHMVSGGEVSTPGSEASRLAIPYGPARRCVDARASLNVSDVRDAPSREADSWQRFERVLGRSVRSYVVAPLFDGRHEIIGALLLVRAGGSRRPFSPESQQIVESLASQAAVSILKNRLVESFRALFEGLIQLTVTAIDEKSPYTGDHCRKVPILTEMIADAACAATDGPLKDLHLTDAERYELRIAALLHDCGKVVTPVHVMDKATKLEAIRDGIELVALRYELVGQEARIRSLERRLDGAGSSEVQREAEALRRELAEELDFLRRCNVGEERMPESDRARVREIALRRRLRGADGRERPVLTAHEVENLTIESGTLNRAERDVMDYHVVATLNLLNELPFPKAMRRVPEIAGCHHERLDGSGYPQHLRGPQLSIQSRILGLADVFEALTAKDRPYKPGRTLTETLDILESMCREGQLDPSLYELFVSEEIHLLYASEHLSPEQIDPPHQEAFERLTSGL